MLELILSGLLAISIIANIFFILLYKRFKKAIRLYDTAIEERWLAYRRSEGMRKWGEENFDNFLEKWIENEKHKEL